MRAVVTGGAGFIGSHVCDALLARGDEVHVLDNLATGNRGNVADGVTLHEGDIRSDAEAVFDAARPEVCFHLAAQADVGTSVERPELDADVNVIGTLRVLEAARRPLALAVERAAGEEYLATWNRLHGTRHVSLRFANVYGPRQLSKLEGGVVAIFMERLAAGERCRIFGDGRQTRDFVYVGDVVAAMLAALGRDGGVYNVGTGRETSVNELYDLCRRIAGSDAEPEYAPPRQGELSRSFLDPGLAERELGWRPQRDLEDGLRATWAWATGA